MRVLFVNENLGGHTTVHLNVRRALADRGDVDARFYDVPAPGLVRKLAAAPIPGLDRWDLDLQPLRYQLAQSALVRRELPRLIADVDVVHAYTHNVALLSAGLLQSRATVVSLDGTNEQNAYRLPYRSPTRFTATALRAVQPFERRVYAAATTVVTHSRWAADSVISYGVDPMRVRIIPFGVTVPPPAPFGSKVGPPRIVFVGRSMERKGGYRLLRLHGQHLRDVAALDLVTLDAVDEAPGVRVVNDITPGDLRLTELFHAATVFAFPSEMDLSPNAVLEAMAAGLPVVALRAGAVGELVENGVTGLLVDPADDDAFVGAIRTIVMDPALAARMGAAARARVAQRFDARRTTAELIEVFREAHERHDGGRPARARGRRGARTLAPRPSSTRIRAASAPAARPITGVAG